MSHNVMNSFFSGGDIKDEVSGRFFGVIGNIDREQETNVFKVAYNRQFKDLVLEDIFDMGSEGIHSDSDYTLNFEEVSQNISERVRSIPKIYNYPSFKQNTTKVTEIGSRHKYPSNYKRVKTKLDIQEEDMYDQFYDMPWVDDVDFDFFEDSILGFIDTLPSQKIFKYDFEQVFSGNSSAKNIINLYDSMTALIKETGADCTDLTSDLIQANIKNAFKSKTKQD